MDVRSFVAMLVAVCSLCATVGASAQPPTIVVLDFKGKGGAKARIQVIRALKDRAAFETNTAARAVLVEEGLDAATEEGRAAIARGLPVDYVVWGSVRGKGSAAKAKIRIAGPKGREITARQAGPPGTGKGNARIRKAAVSLLAAGLAAAPPESRSAKPEEPAKEEEPSPPAAVVTVPIAVEAVTEVEAPTEVEAATEVEEPVAIQVKVRTSTTPYAPYLLILAGAGGRSRKVEIDIDDGAGGTGTRKYESGVYLDIVFRLELRPMAKHRVKGLRGIALEGDGGFGIGLETQPPGSSQRLDTKAWRVLGQLGYFHRFQKGELGGLIGVGFDRLELQTNATIPSIDYLYLRVGPAYRHFFIDRALSLRIDGGFRYPFSYGDLSNTFGEATGFGFDAGIILGGELDVGFAYAARLSFDYFKPQFSGFPNGATPPIPGAVQGRDATDLAINFNVMVGWAF